MRITDRLVSGLRLVGAYDSSGRYFAYTPGSGFAGGADELTYSDGTVIWLIEGTPAENAGKVKLVAQVEEKATKAVVNYGKVEYGYDDGAGGVTEIPDPNEPVVVNPIGSYKMVQQGSPGYNETPVQSGDEVTFNIGWINPEPSKKIIAVNISDAVPDEMELVAVYNHNGRRYEPDKLPPGITFSNNTVSWRISDAVIANTGTVKVTMRVREDMQGSVTNRAEIDYDLQDDNGDTENIPDPGDPKVTLPLGSYKYVAMDSSGAGGAALHKDESVTYYIDVLSPYKKDAATATVEEFIPKGAKVTAYETQNVTITDEDANGDITRIVWEIKGMEPGSTHRLFVKLEITEDAIQDAVDNGEGKLRNNAMVKWHSNNSDPGTQEPDPENPETPFTENPVGTAKYIAAGSPGAGRKPLAVGDEIEYVIQYLNEGNERDLEITDAVPKGMQVKAVMNGGVIQADGSIVWTVPGVQTNEAGTVSVKMLVTQQAIENAQNGEILNAANLKWSDEPGDGEDITTSNPVTSKYVASDSIAGQNGAVVNAGDEISYKIRAVSLYQTDTATVAITDRLPEGIDLEEVTFDGALGTLDEETRTITWVIEGIAPGEYKETDVTIKVTQPAIDWAQNGSGGMLRNEAEVEWKSENDDPSTQEPGPEEPQKPGVENPVSTAKFVAPGTIGEKGGPVAAGDEIQYIIRYLSTYDEVVNARITDYIPKGMEFVSASEGGEYKTDGDGWEIVQWPLFPVEARDIGEKWVKLRVTNEAITAAAEGKIRNDAETEWFTGGDPGSEENPGDLDKTENPHTENPVTAKFVAADSKAGQNSTAVKLGDHVTYVIQYVSPFKHDRGTAVITEKIPEGMKIVEIPDEGGVVSEDERTVTWTRENIAPRGIGSVSIVLEVTQEAISANIGGKIVNDAEIEWDSEGTRELNPNEPEKPRAENPVSATMKYIKEGSGENGTPVKEGDRLNYVIELFSPFTTDTATAYVRDYIPEGITVIEPQSSENPVQYDSDGHAYLEWDITDIPAGGSDTITLVLEVTDASAKAAQEKTNGKIRNEAVITWESQEDPGSQEPGPEDPETPFTENPVISAKYVDKGSAGEDGRPVKAGDIIRYELQYVNPYKANRVNLEIAEKLSDGMVLMNADEVHQSGGRYDRANQTIKWSFEKVQPNAAGAVYVELMVTQDAIAAVTDGKLQNLAYYNWTEIDEDDNPTGETEDEEDTAENPVTSKFVAENSDGYGGKGLKAGDKVEYIIQVVSPYESDTAKATIVDRIPAGMTVENDGGGQEIETGVYQWEVTVQAGEMEQVRITLEVTDTAVNNAQNGKIRNEAAVTWESEGNEPNPAEPEKPAVENPVGTAKFIDGQSTGAGNKTLRAGDKVEYIIQYMNPYDGKDADAVITEKIPAGMKVLSYTEGGVYDAVNHTIIWSIGQIPERDTGAVRVYLEVTQAAIESAVGGRIVNHADVKYTADGETDENPEVKTENPVTSKSVAEGSAGENGTLLKQGNEVKYIIYYASPYQKDTATAEIIDYIPAGMEFMDASDGGTHDEETGTVRWTRTGIRPREPGDEDTFVTVTLKVVDITQAKNGMIRNEAEVYWKSEVEDPNEQEPGPKTPDKPAIENPVGTAKYVDKASVGAGGTPLAKGDIVKYVIQAVNPDEEQVHMATIIETIPEGMEYVDGGGTPGTDGEGRQTRTWTANVGPGGMEKIFVTLRVTGEAIEASKADNGRIRNTARVSWDDGSEDENVYIDNPTKSYKYVADGAGKNSGTVKQGDIVRYTIQYVNPYRNNSAAVTITDHLPKGAKIVDAAGGTHNMVDDTLTWELEVTAGSGGSIEVALEVTKEAVDASQNGMLLNTANLKWEPIGPVNDDEDDDGDDDTGDSEDGDKDDEEITAENPLAGAKFVNTSGAGADGAAVYIGETVSYTIVGYNPYDVPANVTLTDFLPSGMEYVSTTIGTPSADGKSITAEFTEVDVGRNVSMTVRLKVTEDAVLYANEHTGGKIRNEAEVKWSTDGDEEDITEVPGTENPVSSLKFVAAGSTGEGGKPVKLGDLVKYEIQFVNPSAEKSAVLTIKDSLPEGMRVEGFSEGGNYNRFSGEITWTLDVEPRGSGTLVVIAEVTQAAIEAVTHGRIQNKAVFDWDFGGELPPITETPDPAENPVTSKFAESIMSAGGIEKTGTSVIAGDSISYEIQAASPFTHNTGTATITEYLPEGMEFLSATDNPEIDTAARTLTWENIKVSAGQTASVTVEMRVTPDAVRAAQDGRIRNNAVVTWKCDDDGEIPETPPEPETPGTETPVATAKYVNIGSTGYKGQELTKDAEVQYVIQAVSPFIRDMGEVTIVEHIPNGMEAVNDSYGTGTLSEDKTTVTWIFKDVAPQSVVNAKVTLLVTASALDQAADGFIENKAEVTWKSQDENETPPKEPQEPSVKNPVTPLAANKLIRSGNGAGGAKVKANSNVTYTIEYKNNSSKPLNIVIEDTLADGLSYISHTEAKHPGNSKAEGRTVKWTLEIPARESGFVEITAMVTAQKNQTISNQAKISWSQKDSDDEMRTGVVTPPPVTNVVEDTGGDGGGSDNGGGSGGGGGQPAENKVEFHWNDGREDDIYYSTTVRSGQTVSEPVQPEREGYFFLGWYTSETGRTPFDFREAVTRETHLYAKWQENILNMDDHFAYIIGYPDGNVRPNSNITRAEAATIFFRLLKPEVRGEKFSTQNNFTDVNASLWYNKAVSTLVRTNIIGGYPDGTFRGDNTITRAEFAAIAANFLGTDAAYTGASAFSDIRGHWAERSINLAVKQGWIEGYTDGTFRPEAKITRAEVMTLVNRMLNRLPQSPDDLHADMQRWPDNADTSAWYYLAVQEATNTHDYEMEGTREIWSGMRDNYDWAALEKPDGN